MNPLVQNTTQKVRVISLPKIHHQKVKEILLVQITTQKVKVISLPKIRHQKVKVIPLVQNTTQKVTIISLSKIHHAESKSGSSCLNTTQKVKVIPLVQKATQKVKVMSLPKIHHTKSDSFCPKHLAPVADEMVLELLEPHHLPDLLPITPQGRPPLQNNLSHILSGLHLEQKNDT